MYLLGKDGRVLRKADAGKELLQFCSASATSASAACSRRCRAIARWSLFRTLLLLGLAS
jgi:hypothetical protein